MDCFDFTGKKIFVTGASSGIGKDVALRYAKLRPELLVITGRSDQKLQQVRVQCESQGVKCIAYSVDMMNNEEIDQLASKVEKDTKSQVDVFVACHGFGGKDLCQIGSVDYSILDEVMQVNYFSVVRLTNLVSRFMSQDSSIVYISSINSSHPSPGGTAYCCAKAALSMMMKCAAIDLSSRRIRVNTVAPGYVDTPFQSYYFSTPQEQHDAMDQIGSTLPLGHLTTVTGVVNAVLYLSSSLACDVTGHEHVVDCGNTLLTPNL